MKKITALSFFVVAFLISGQHAHAVFSDVSSNHQYYEAIEYLQDNGIVEGYEDGNYRPDQKVNRAEALKIILLGSDVLVPEIQVQDIFPDVVHGTWYGKFAAKGKNLGIVSGDSDTGMFRPGDTINLAEILKILLRTNDIEASTPEANPYADVPTDAWFAPYFNYAFSISLLPQSSGEDVEPALPVTRGLMAQLMYQLAMKPEGYQEGEASYYGEMFHGKGTASGEVFDASELTAAHRTLPFGTWLKVKNLANDMEVYVRVNDRGPYAGDNRIIDLSKAAFESIASLSSGVINVSITPVSGPPGGSSSGGQVASAAECLEKPTLQFYSESTFDNITLNASLPNAYLEDEVFYLEGSSASDKSGVSAFLSRSGSQQISFLSETSSEGAFAIPIYFPELGSQQFGVLPGESGSSIVETVTVLPASCLASVEDSSLPKPLHLDLGYDEGDFVLKWQVEAGQNVSKVTFIQGSNQKDYLLKGKVELTPYYPDFEGWTAGDIQVEVRSGTLSSDSFAEVEVVSWSPPVTASFKAETHHQYIVDEEKARPISLPSSLKAGMTLTLKADPKVNFDELGRIILPSGQVDEVLLESPSHEASQGNLGINIFPASANDVRLKYTPATSSLHFFEINDEQGIAAINIPLYPENSYPLIPNPVDLSDLKADALSSDLGALQNQMLQLVNVDRAAHGLAAVSLDSSLNQLAQSRSDDMVTRDYFGHWNPEGQTANDLRKNHAITQYVSENIARDVNLPLAQHGLMRSASHRSNILNAEWQRVGFGFSQDGNKGTVFVQIFSDAPINFSDVSALRGEIIAELNSQRSSTINLQNNLNSLAQSWTEKWNSEKWCDLNDTSCNPLTSPGGTFTDSLRDGGVNETLGAYYRGDSSFENAKAAIAENVGLKDSRWKNIGLGIAQDSFGVIHLFVTYTE